MSSVRSRQGPPPHREPWWSPKLNDDVPAGVLLGSVSLATELDRLDLIDEYRFLVRPRIVGHGPTLHQSGLPSTRRLELISPMPLRNGAIMTHYRRAG